MTDRLGGKVAVITGATSGIGCWWTTETPPNSLWRDVGPPSMADLSSR